MFAAEVDDGFETLAQRRNVGTALTGLPLPRDHHKTLMALGRGGAVLGGRVPRPATPGHPHGVPLGRSGQSAPAGAPAGPPPAPGSSDVGDLPLPGADLAEFVRRYGLRNWVEQSDR